MITDPIVSVCLPLVCVVVPMFLVFALGVGYVYDEWNDP